MKEKADLQKDVVKPGRKKRKTLTLKKKIRK